MRQPQVKTVELFINNLDEHIASSYKKLRKDRERGTPILKKYQVQGDTTKEDTILRDNSSTFDQTSKLMFTS